MNFSILYEDDHILAIDKPSGVMVHPDGHSQTETVSDWLLKTYPESKDVGEPQTLSNGKEIMRPGIVHRIDTETSGVLLLAKTKEGHAHLKEQFQDRTTKKTYLAFVYGALKNKKGVIDRPIGRLAQHFRLWSAQRGARGELREAITHYEVLAQGDSHTCLRVIPLTGRTHQIRVHLKAIHHPIVCDKLYAPNHPCDLGFNRLALHALSIRFLDRGGKEQEVQAPPPPDIAHALADIGVEW
jgi:23S rRNA pseudouridine1911/1915/1917 synthase